MRRTLSSEIAKLCDALSNLKTDIILELEPIFKPIILTLSKILKRF